MYNRHFGLSRQPFSIAPNPRFLYMSRQHREALAHLTYGARSSDGFAQLTGEVGTGKTTICRCLVERLPQEVDVALILNPRVTALELVASVCDELEIVYPKGTTSIKVLTDVLNAYLLQSHAVGRRTVLIIDEAQCLGADALEQVRLLTNLETSNAKLLQIILVGQPELRELLARDDLRQLAQRITARFHLSPMTRTETAAYIRHRLQLAGARSAVFDERVIDMVHNLANGIPRLINVLCDRAMLGAFAEGVAVVDARIMRKAANEVLPAERPGVKLTRSRGWLGLAAVLLLGTGLAIGLWYGVSRHDHEVAATTPTAMGSYPVMPPTPTQQLAVTAPQPESPHATATAIATGTQGAARRATAEPADQSGDPVREASPPSAQGSTTPAVTQFPPTQATATSWPDVPDGMAEAAAAIETGPDLAGAPPEPGAQGAGLGDPAWANASPPSPEHASAESASSVPIAVQPSAGDRALAAPIPAIPSPPPSPVLPSLSERLDAVGVKAAAHAWSGLYRLWGYDSAAANDDQACAQAPNAGLGCLKGSGNWGLLRRFDRPVILLLQAGSGRTVPVVMQRIEGDRVTLDVDGEVLRFARGEVEQRWNGVYRLLWKKPPSGNVVLQQGMRSSDVRWLRERLGEAGDDENVATDSTLYDASLSAAVKTLQGKRGLIADGVAGAHTLIVLNNLTADPEIPRLSGSLTAASE